MTEKLRAALHETAEHAQPATVPPSLWDDAQRSRSRNGLVLASLVVVLVCALGSGLAVLTQPTTELAPADGDGAAVPSYLFAISADDTDEFDYQGEPPGAVDFAVGRTAALLPSREGAWVAVSAEDGSYRRLPEVSGGTRPVLSPDGRLLAWGERAMEHVQVTVVDLASGRTTGQAFDDNVAGVVVDLRWSPDSRFLGVQSNESGTPRMRVLDVRNGATTSIEGWDENLVAGVTPDGELAVVSGGRLEVRGPAGVRVAQEDVASLDGLAVSRDGALAAGVRPGEVLPDGESGPEVVLLPTNAGDPGSGSILMGSYTDVRLLGWTSDGHVVVLGTPLDEDGSPSEGSRADLLLIQLAEWGHEVHRVGTVDATDLGGVQIATDLMTLDRPTAGRGDPEWIDRDFPKARAMFFGVVLVLVVWFVRRWRRGGFKGTPGGGGRADVTWGQLEAEGRFITGEAGGYGAR